MRFFSPKTTSDDLFSHIVSEQTTFLIQKSVLAPLHGFKYLHMSDLRHPPCLLLISPITDANSLCLVVWARVLTDFPVVSLPEPQRGSVFSRAAVASRKSRHTRLPFFFNVAV